MAERNDTPTGTSAAVRMRNIERIWQLRAQVLEHVAAIEALCDQMSELPHVCGVLPDDVSQYLDDVKAMLTPGYMDEDDEKGLEAEDLAQWRALLAFAEARGISLED